MTAALREPDAAISDAVAQLVEGREPKNAHAILRAAITAMSDHINGLVLMQQFVDRINRFLIMMSQGIAGTKPGTQLTPQAKVMFTAAAQLGKLIVGPGQNNVLWCGLIQSLRAECLLLLGETDAANAAAMTAASLLEHVGANRFVDQRTTYVANLIAYLHGTNGATPPPITTRELLAELQDALPQT